MGPSLAVRDINVSKQLYTCLGAHPFDVGFAYYAGITTPPGEKLPVLDLPHQSLPARVKKYRGQYAVITTGSTTEARRVMGQHINPVIEYVKSLGLMPVFVGREDFVGIGNLDANFPTDIAFDQGLDMRNKTTLIESACVLQHARFVLGLDNGLLHLASLMQGARIIFGYNITSIEHREPRRDHGRTINIHLTDQDLICQECQSKWVRVLDHSFNKCYYKDVKCIDLLFANGGERFKRAIDDILK
jgi:ADP-heptose:LPS heptosyltransferase